MATTERLGIAEFYERRVLPALAQRLDQAFPEFAWQRDAQGWRASNQEFTHQRLGVRADRVVCHGDAPRGFLVYGQGPVLWTTYLNHDQPARGREFIDTVRQLAERAGLDPAELDRPPTPRERRQALLHDTFILCRRELATERGAPARDYLAHRGIPPDRIEQTTLGLAPTRERLRLGLAGHGYTPEEIESSGVLADERWAGRIVGAWRDEQSRVVTLWARSTDPEVEERYLYLRGAPRTGSLPYGLSDLLASASRADRAEVTLVEGVLDVHVLRAHDVGSVAALGGTSIARDTFERLAELGVERLVLAYDNDAPGRAGLVRAIDQGVRAARAPDLWVIDPDLYGTAKDPGDLIRLGGPTAWRAASSAPSCAVAWRALDLTGPLDVPDTPLRRRAALARAGAWLGALPARLAVEQATALDVVSESLGYDRDAVRRAFRARHWQHDPTREASRVRGASR